MSRIVIVEKNKDGKIELATEELQKMLDDAYNQGYSDGKSSVTHITYPSYPTWYDNFGPLTTDKVIITCNTAEWR